MLLWIKAEVILYGSQKLDSYFLIFEEAQDYGDRFNILPDLGKDSNSFDSQVLWIILEFVLKATKYCLLIQPSRFP